MARAHEAHEKANNEFTKAIGIFDSVKERLRGLATNKEEHYSIPGQGGASATVVRLVLHEGDVVVEVLAPKHVGNPPPLAERAKEDPVKAWSRG